MIIYKTIETIEEAENILLKDGYNIDLFGPIIKRDVDYMSYLTKALIKIEDEKFYALVDKIISRRFRW